MKLRQKIEKALYKKLVRKTFWDIYAKHYKRFWPVTGNINQGNWVVYGDYDENN